MANKHEKICSALLRIKQSSVVQGNRHTHVLLSDISNCNNLFWKIFWQYGSANKYSIMVKNISLEVRVGLKCYLPTTVMYKPFSAYVPQFPLKKNVDINSTYIINLL